ncbi:MAG TPA: hypothetical protein IAA30_05330 [Candidatus Treponema faecavium]|nr:hypothetical protein [Candidatus Treponema faecavium]
MAIEIYINGAKIDAVLDTERTAGDIFKSITQECEAHHAAVIGVAVDNKPIPADRIDAVSAAPLECISRVDFTTVTKDDVKTLLAAYEQEFSRLASEIETIPVLLQSGKDKAASEIIQSFADIASRFCQSVSLTVLFDDMYQTRSIDGMSVNDFFASFSSILTEFASALAVKDTVMIGDLAEYEIKPRIDTICSMIRSVSE